MLLSEAFGGCDGCPDRAGCPALTHSSAFGYCGKRSSVWMFAERVANPHIKHIPKPSPPRGSAGDHDMVCVLREKVNELIERVNNG